MSAPSTEVLQPTAGPAPGAGTPAAIHPDLWPRPEDFPNVHELVIEDGKPVDNIFSEKQMRLLTEPLHGGWPGPDDGQPFVAMANVGVFHTAGEPPIVPDALLAVGVRQGDLTQRENLSYFVWLRGKSPDVVVEIVSNREGGEDTDKQRVYARIGVPYYVIFDPLNQLERGVLRGYELRGRRYRPMERPWFFEEVGLGVDLWQGRYEDLEGTWLRWCNRDGQLIPTGAERAARAEQRAEDERQRAVRAEQRAEDEHQRAVRAEQRAKDEHRELERTRQELLQLQEKQRALGTEPPP